MKGLIGIFSCGTLVPLIAFSWAVWVNPLFLDRPFFGGLFCLGCGLFSCALFWRLKDHLPRLQNPYRWLLGQLFVYVFLCLRPSPSPLDARLLVVGIDGAHWDLVERFHMPTLMSLRQNSIYGSLQADEPLFSPLLWTTIASGKRPDEHGIRGFRTQSTDAQSARFWEIADANGMSVGLYKWLVTWPPVPFQSGGFVVPAWLASTPETWPENLSVVKEIELSKRLRRRNVMTPRSTVALAVAGIPLGFRLSTLIDSVQLYLQQRWLNPSEELVAWAQQLLRIQMDRDVFIQQLHTHRPDVAAITLYATDALGHTHWKWLDCKSSCPPYANAVPEAYAQADAVLHELKAHVSPDTAILVLSDHGFRAATAADAAQRFQPKTEQLLTQLQTAFPKLDAAKLGQKMVLSLPLGTRQSVLDNLVGALNDFVVSESGEALYRTELLPHIPNGIGVTLRLDRVTESDLQRLTVNALPLSAYVSLQEPHSGSHDSMGIFALYRQGTPSREQSIHQLDILPSILALLKVNPAADLEGRSILENQLLPIPSYNHLRVSPQPSEEIDVNTEFLEQLGYIE